MLEDLAKAFRLNRSEKQVVYMIATRVRISNSNMLSLERNPILLYTRSR